MFLVAVVVARLVVFVFAALGVRVFRNFSVAVLAILAGSAVVTAFVIEGMVFQFLNFPSDYRIMPWLFLGGALLGAADALITLLWARFSARLSRRTVYLYVLSCNALSLVVYFVVTLLPLEIAAPLAAGIFVVSLMLAKKSLDVSEPFAWEYSRPVLKGALRRILEPIIGTSILCFMAGLMLQISGQQEISLSSFQQISLFTSAIVIFTLLLPALVIKKPFNITKMYAFAIPLSATGFLLLPLIWNAAGGIVNSFAQLGSMVAGIILWCIMADISRDTHLPSEILFSVSFVAMNLAQLAGTLVGYFNQETLKQGDLVLTTVALVAAYLLFMAALFLFKDKKFKGEEPFELKQELSNKDHLQQRCDIIAQKHQFTPRETEIFYFLAQGFTIPLISEKLFVSENTVKSHVKSIYQKLDIHLRSELIELVNAE